MKLHRVEYRYPGKGAFVLGPLDLEGPDDRPWLILGPSGSGKSTLLRILGGSLKPGRGEVRGPERASSAYLPQLPERVLAGRNLAEDLTGRIRPGVEERRRLRHALAESGLTGVPLSRRSRSLSAGERRRLALTLIRLSGYKNVALDEPEAALDAAGHRRLLNLLKARQEGIPASGGLWIGTHRFDLFGPLDPWIVVLSEGKTVACGDLGQVLGNTGVARVLCLDDRPPFGVWKGLNQGRLTRDFTFKIPLKISPKTSPKIPCRDTLIRLQLLEKMGIN